MIAFSVTVNTSHRQVFLVFQVNRPFSELPSASISKRGQVQNLCCENEFYLQVSENSFSYERFRT